MIDSPQPPVETQLRDFGRIRESRQIPDRLGPDLPRELAKILNEFRAVVDRELG
jgi:hypothetical protein